MKTQESFSTFSDLISVALEELDGKRGITLSGIPSGFSALDRLTSGWQKGELIVLAARPGMGKTALLTSMARNAAMEFNVPVAFFSLEMPSTQVVNRLISAEAEIENDKILSGKLAPHEWELLHHRIHRINNAPIFIDDTPSISVQQLEAKCLSLSEVNNIEIIFVDYLQLMDEAPVSKPSANEEQRLTSIIRALKNLARKLNLPIIITSQLNRSVEVRGGHKRPCLTDLRGSGAIEDDADKVLFLYRPEYYGIAADESGNSVLGMCEVILAKNRVGILDTIQLRFAGKYSRFTDLDDFYSMAAPLSIDNFAKGSTKKNYNTRSYFDDEDSKEDAPF